MILKRKNCPWCGHKLNFIELIFLDEHSPKICKYCGKYIKSSAVNSIISVVLPFVLCFISYYFFGIEMLLSLSLLLLIPILRFLLAEPLKYNINSTMRICLQCRSVNVPFVNSISKICRNCTLSGKKQSNS